MARNHILFVNPDYHCSFFLRDEFRALGWKADIYKPDCFPEALLYADDCITVKKSSSPSQLIFNRLVFFCKILFKYDFFLIYGSAEINILTYKKFWQTFFPKNFS